MVYEKHICDYLKDVYLPKGQGQVALMLLHLLYEQGKKRRLIENNLGVLDEKERKICDKIKEFIEDDMTKDAINQIYLIMNH